MNDVYNPTLLDYNEAQQFNQRIANRLISAGAELLKNVIGTDPNGTIDNIPELCYDNRGRIIVRVTLDYPEAILEDVRMALPRPMGGAIAESTETNIQYPNVAYAGVDFVTINKVDVEALCEKIDKLAVMAGYKDGLNGMSLDPEFGDFSLAFARLFDLHGGLIYNDSNKMMPPKGKGSDELSYFNNGGGNNDT